MVRKVYLLWMFIAFGTSFGFAQTAPSLWIYF
ncbi:MAG: hypothetical protein JWQ42_4030 [Edaphobacter sp.]|nr:hypothetical protein [Edaphobacter sp.]